MLDSSRICGPAERRTSFTVMGLHGRSHSTDQQLSKEIVNKVQGTD